MPTQKDSDWSCGIDGLTPLELTFATEERTQEWMSRCAFISDSCPIYEYSPFSSSNNNNTDNDPSLNPSDNSISFPTPNPSPLKSKLQSKRQKAQAVSQPMLHFPPSTPIDASSSSSSSSAMIPHPQGNDAVKLQEATTLLQSTLGSPYRRRRRGMSLAAKTEHLTVALESLRQKRSAEQAGLIHLLKTKDSVLGNYGKELRRFVGGEEGGDYEMEMMTLNRPS
ncbi:hypothetical protein BCR33DRAFT_502649 [Rhizoclosmatium globosum]|uniref:Uncharacterized protein n=1 Tax=Rhizoclosmatium globosum TaxID=329046 RepID=A0A1Y2CVP0_9FUNG|nr:hypothetical protein BCR33DRAFT_502649 [Rhizoclosmatium globosum]|eukprot:ORY51092.1 hypothetical protein BCR33DRAFT_502649 [Rhizoclosmatium globosum]